VLIKKYLIFFAIILVLITLVSIISNPDVDRGVILWFDDGLKNTFDVAYPMMREQGYVGMVSVITDCVGGVFEDEEYRDKPCMNLEELKTLKQEGWEIVSHSKTHPYLNETSRDQAEDEIIGSKRWINDNLGISTKVFVYPYSVFAHQDIVRENYEFARVTDRDLWDGKNNSIPIVYIKDGGTWKADYWLKKVKEEGGYAVFLLHSIVDSPEGSWENTPEEFQGLLSNISTYNLPVVTLSEVSEKSSKQPKKLESFPIDMLMDFIEFIRKFSEQILQKLADLLEVLQL